MKKILILSSVVLVFIVGCKKKDTPAPVNSNTNPVNTTISNGFPSSGANNISGVFKAEKLSIPSMGASQYIGEATFSNTPYPFTFLYLYVGILNNGVQAGNVKINDTILKFNATTTNQNFIYKDTSASPNYSNGVTWSVSGNSNFSAFNTAVTRGFPVISNVNIFPTTFSKSQNLTINLSSGGYTNTDSIIVVVDDYTNPSIAKYLPGNASSVTFTVSEMANLSTTSPYNQIFVYAKNISNMTVNSKNYIFVMQNDIGHSVTITP